MKSLQRRIRHFAQELWRSKWTNRKTTRLTVHVFRLEVYWLHITVLFREQNLMRIHFLHISTSRVAQRVTNEILNRSIILLDHFLWDGEELVFLLSKKATRGKGEEHETVLVCRAVGAASVVD